MSAAMEEFMANIQLSLQPRPALPGGVQAGAVAAFLADVSFCARIAHDKLSPEDLEYMAIVNAANAICDQVKRDGLRLPPFEAGAV